MKKHFKTLRPGDSIVMAINQNNTLILITFSFLFGLMIGVLTFKLKNTVEGFYSGEFKNFTAGLQGGFWSILINSIMDILPFTAAVLLSGTCMIGSVLTPVIIAVRGATLGMIMGYVYVNYSLTGIVFNVLIIIPPALVSTLALILSGREAFSFSLLLARLITPKSKSELLYNDFKLYCMRQLIVLGFFFVSVILQAVMALAFYSFFDIKI